MEYRINSYNKNYVMINTLELVLEIQRLQFSSLSIENSEYLGTLWDILKSVKYHNKQRRLMHINEIDEVAININSELLKFLFSKNKIIKLKKITLDQIIHASLISIENQEWNYYNIISNIITNYGTKQIKSTDYSEFKEIYGEEITNYIVNSTQIISNIDRYRDDKIVYLYNGDGIEEKELPRPSKKKPRTKTK